MSLHVTVRDEQTGETEETRVADGDYLLLTVGGCHVGPIQTYPTTGTHVITIKGHRPLPLPGTPPCPAPGCLLLAGHDGLHDIRTAAASTDGSGPR